jgi:hypothetical protein
MSDTTSEAASARSWMNPSVVAFSRGRDPLVAAREEAAILHELAVVADAAGPPVDVFALAEHLGITLSARHDLVDAQIKATDAGMVLEYNPSRPRGRLRFNIAHELAHSRFADVGNRPRHRSAAGSVATVDGDDWELELVCDVVASELLMPPDIVDGILTIDPDIDFLMEYRRRMDVSTEALLRRIVRGTPRPLVLAALSRPTDSNDGQLRADYVDASPTGVDLMPGLSHGDRLRDLATALACSAVGQTARGEETVQGVAVRVQAVGIPAYPGRRWPRVLALLEPVGAPRSVDGIEFVAGDIVEAADADVPVVIAHVVPDSTHAWSRFGVGGALGRAFPHAAGAYRAWVLTDPSRRALGSVHFSDVPTHPGVTVASVVAQAGFGASSRPRLDYDALERGLARVGERAAESNAIVHVPRLGAGQAGGRWDLIEAALSRQLVDRGVPVVVHTLPSRGGRG